MAGAQFSWRGVGGDLEKLKFYKEQIVAKHRRIRETYKKACAELTPRDIVKGGGERWTLVSHCKGGRGGRLSGGVSGDAA